MRIWLLTLFAFLISGSAGAQGTLAEMMCQSRPTLDCALELAVEATRQVEPSTKDVLPWGRLIETASRAGRVDIALKLADRLDENSAIATSDLVSALTRANRLAEVGPILSRLGKKPGDFAFSIAPVLVELQRYDELEAFAKTIQPPAPAFQVEAWQIIGDLLAKRADAALDRLARMPEPDRKDMVSMAAEMLYYSGAIEQSRPIGATIPPDRPILLCQIAEGLRDRALAAICADSLMTAPKEDEPYLRVNVTTALAAAGDWQRAIEVADALDAQKKAFAYVNVAIYSRDPQVLKLIDRKMKEDPVTFNQDQMKSLLVRALVLCGYGPVALAMVNSSTTSVERETLSIVAAVALAEVGKPQEALRLALSLTDPYRKSWALWEVASKMTP